MKVIPVSRFQEQFWLINMLAPKNTAYNIPVVLRLDSEPDIEILEESLNILTDRHESLRTFFSFDENGVHQNICKAGDVKNNIEVIDNLPQPTPQNLPQEILDEVHAPFELDKLPLMRVKLFKTKEAIYLTIIFHHIIVDLHSKDVFSREISIIYNSLKSKKKILLPKIQKQYSDYAEWHNVWLKEKKAKKMILSWLEELTTPSLLLKLPTDFPRPKTISLDGKRKFFRLDEDLSLRVHECALQHSTYSYVIFLTAYAILLHKLSQQNKIVIGVPLSNRRQDEFKDTFGCFVNAVPVTVDFQTDSTVNEIRLQVRHKMLQGHRKQEIPFLSLLDSNSEKRNMAYNPYYQTGFTFEPPMDICIDGIISVPIPVEREGSQLDLFFTMWEEEKTFQGYIEYSTNLFSYETIKTIYETFVTIIEEILNGDKKISDLNIEEENSEKSIKQNNGDWLSYKY